MSEQIEPHAPAGSGFDPGSIHSPRLRRLYDYWLAKAGARALPARADIDPVEIPWAIGHLSLIDVEPGGEYRFRLDAPRNAEFFKRDMTGLTLAEYPFPERAAFMREGYNAAVASRRPYLAARDFTIDYRRWQYEILLLPLSADGERVNMLMSMLEISRDLRA
jgi:hypothetical protein